MINTVPLLFALTWREVIANSEIGRRIRPRVRQSIRTKLRRTSYLSRVRPYDLAEVSPGSKRADVDGIATIRAGVFGHLSVIHRIREHKGNLSRCEAGTDVLTIIAVACGSVGEKERR